MKLNNFDITTIESSSHNMEDDFREMLLCINLLQKYKISSNSDFCDQVLIALEHNSTVFLKRYFPEELI